MRDSWRNVFNEKLSNIFLFNFVFFYPANPYAFCAVIFPYNAKFNIPVNNMQPSARSPGPGDVSWTHINYWIIIKQLFNGGRAKETGLTTVQCLADR